MDEEKPNSCEKTEADFPSRLSLRRADKAIQL